MISPHKNGHINKCVTHLQITNGSTVLSILRLTALFKYCQPIHPEYAITTTYLFVFGIFNGSRITMNGIGIRRIQWRKKMFPFWFWAHLTLMECPFRVVIIWAALLDIVITRKPQLGYICVSARIRSVLLCVSHDVNRCENGERGLSRWLQFIFKQWFFSKCMGMRWWSESLAKTREDKAFEQSHLTYEGIKIDFRVG